jgi:hypothetical protein
VRGLDEDVVRQGLILDKEKCKQILKRSLESLVAVWEKAEPGGQAPK